MLMLNKAKRRMKNEIKFHLSYMWSFRFQFIELESVRLPLNRRMKTFVAVSPIITL